MIFCHDKTSKAFASTILYPGQGPHPAQICASLHRRVLLSLPVRGRASSLSSATVRTLGSKAGTSGLTGGSWYVLAGAARPCAVVRLSQVTLTSKDVSPSQRASAAWTTGSPSISPRVKPSPARKVRSRRRNKEISLRAMDLMVGP